MSESADTIDPDRAAALYVLQRGLGHFHDGLPRVAYELLFERERDFDAVKTYLFAAIEAAPAIGVTIDTSVATTLVREALEAAEAEHDVRASYGATNGTGQAHTATDDAREPEHLTDLGNAQRFGRQHAGRVLYVEDLAGWHLWDGRRYARDKTNAAIRLAQQTVQSIYADAAAHADSAERKRIADHARKTEAEKQLRAMLALAKAHPDIVAVADTFDRDPFLFNVINGTLNLRTCELRDHRPENRLTKLASVVFNPAATCPRFEAFLARILPAPAVRNFVQRAVGYSLTADTRPLTAYSGVRCAGRRHRRTCSPR